MSVGWATKSDGHDLAADDKNSGSTVVLDEVLAYSQNRTSGEAALFIHHHSLHRGGEAEKLAELIVCVGHVDSTRGAEN
ncbi:hypothetical protein SUGI_0039070 [Cryptomeria japonica]|nr:hypothetical protein SUGI_0039070 [Cryptomeria japonica]